MTASISPLKNREKPCRRERERDRFLLENDSRRRFSGCNGCSSRVPRRVQHGFIREIAKSVRRVVIDARVRQLFAGNELPAEVDSRVTKKRLVLLTQRIARHRQTLGRTGQISVLMCARARDRVRRRATFSQAAGHRAGPSCISTYSRVFQDTPLRSSRSNRFFRALEE
jgi:hypothetical protein